MKSNEEILTERCNAYNEIIGPRVGDYLKLPYGIYTRFTYDWGDKIQTGGGNGFYLGNGYISYSGSLDSGVKKSDIKQILEIKIGSVWFFNNDVKVAHNGHDTKMMFRVFEPIEGADLSGCPQIKEFEHKKFLETVDTITRINGNGQPYTLPLPKLVIMDTIYNTGFFDDIFRATGIKFEKTHWNYEAQPIKTEQFATFMLMHNWKHTFYNNSTHKNVLFLKLNHDNVLKP